MNIFLGMKKLWIIQNWTIWRGVISLHFKAFLKVKVQKRNILGSLRFRIFFGYA